MLWSESGGKRRLLFFPEVVFRIIQRKNHLVFSGTFALGVQIPGGIPSPPPPHLTFSLKSSGTHGVWQYYIFPLAPLRITTQHIIQFVSLQSSFHLIGYFILKWSHWYLPLPNAALNFIWGPLRTGLWRGLKRFYFAGRVFFLMTVELFL